MKLTVGTKIGLGFAIVFVLMIASSLLTYYKIQANRAVEDYILNIRFPTIQSDAALDANLQKTQLRTRDAILHAGDRSALEANRQSYGQAVQGASEALAQLKQFSKDWVLQENRDRLARIDTAIPRLQEIQHRIFALADEGSPAAVKEGIQILFTEAKPTNDAMLKDLADQEVSMVNLLNQRERPMLEAAGRSIVVTISIATLLAIMLGAMTALFIGRKISGATSSLLGQAEAIAAGDLTQEELQATSRDELGDLTAAINKMQMRLRELIASITENAQNVANASEEFSAVSQQISANSQETSAQAGTVSAATEEVNRNLQTVATATEEMSATVQEIAKNASEAAKIAAEALKTAAETNAVVGKLGDSSAEIGQVIKVITSIAQKTDLLALNATVEAARAGEAGAGFAVVANEVKELAKQTATATEDISKRIEAIQVDTKSAVQAIKSISGIIDKVNSISSTIATAVEEQSATTAEMSRNLSEAAKGSGEVAQNIHGVAQAAQNTSQGSTDSLKAAKSLAEMSTQLRQLVGQFKIDNRSTGNGSQFLHSSGMRHGRSSVERAREEVPVN